MAQTCDENSYSINDPSNLPHENGLFYFIVDTISLPDSNVRNLKGIKYKNKFTSFECNINVEYTNFYQSELLFIGILLADEVYW
jgi:hypothetical protein